MEREAPSHFDSRETSTWLKAGSSLGSAFLWCWILTSFRFFPMEPILPFPTTLFTVALVSFACAAAYCLHKQVASFIAHTKLLCIGTAVSGITGSALSILAATFRIEILSVFAWAIIVCTWIVSFIAWIVLYRGQDLRDSTTMLGLSFAIACVIYYVMVGMPDLLRSISFCILPLVSSLTVQTAYAAPSGPPPMLFKHLKTDKDHSIDGFGQLMFGNGLVAMVTTCMAVIMHRIIPLTIDEPLFAIAILSGSVVAFVSSFLPSYRNKTTISFFIRVSIPLSAIALCLIAASLFDLGFILLIIGTVFLALIFLLLFLRVSVLYDLPITSFFVLALSAALGVAAGCILAEAALALLPFAQIGIPSVCLIGLTCLCITASVLVSGKSLFAPLRHLDDQDEKREGGKWVNACQAIAEQYSLSPRETEILMLLGKGRNAEFISNVFIISRYTAKTHINNIYKKLDIHSQKEILDLIDAGMTRK